MKIFVCVLMVSISVIQLNGQSSGIAAFFRIGYSRVTNAGEQLALMAPPVTHFSNNFYGIGGDGYFKLNRSILGADAMISAHGNVLWIPTMPNHSAVQQMSEPDI